MANTIDEIVKFNKTASDLLKSFDIVNNKLEGLTHKVEDEVVEHLANTDNLKDKIADDIKGSIITTVKRDIGKDINSARSEMNSMKTTVEKTINDLHHNVVNKIDSVVKNVESKVEVMHKEVTEVKTKAMSPDGIADNLTKSKTYQKYTEEQLTKMVAQQAAISVLAQPTPTNTSTEQERIMKMKEELAMPGDILDFMLIENGASIRYAQDKIDIRARSNGYELFCPHNPQEYEMARQYLVKIGKPKAMGPLGIYKPNTNNGDGRKYALNSAGLGQLGWRVVDGSKTWWAVDSIKDQQFDQRPMNEPNGDYDAYAFLGISYNDEGYVKHYNDDHHKYSYTTYLCVKRKK